MSRIVASYTDHFEDTLAVEDCGANVYISILDVSGKQERGEFCVSFKGRDAAIKFLLAAAAALEARRA